MNAEALTMKLLAAGLVSAALIPVASAATQYASYRGKATVPGGHAFFGTPVKLSFIDRARTSGSVRYRVCVIENRRKCYSRLFRATPSYDWDSFTVKVTQNLRPMIVLWYVGRRLVWATTVQTYGE